MIIWIKYVLRENRKTSSYNKGTNWFGRYEIVWTKWFFNNRFIIIKLKKLINEKHNSKIPN